MCGFAGLCKFDGSLAQRSVLESMTTTFAHRGPDDEGYWVEGSVGLGHRRLSIIDIADSHQPMSSPDGRWVLAFNGEIFNYQELRANLRNYPFRTGGDTETILAGLAAQGLRFVDQLRGQFAFAVLDRASGVTHLVRDRLGILPLYFWASDKLAVFGSEIDAILNGMPVQPEVDLSSLDAYLWGRSVPAPHTLFDGIHKVEPGHRVEIDVNGRIQSFRYWQPPEEDERTWKSSDAVDAVDSALGDAVRHALVADVPVGAYLSGGVDSSLIVAKAAALRDEPLKTFAAGFGDPRHDELRWARMMSRHVGSDHHEVHIDARDFEELWPRLTRHRGAPMSEPADFAVYRLALAAREQVRVVLSGEGGDELFGGYPKYEVARAMAAISRLPAGLRLGLGQRVDSRLPASLSRFRIALRVFATPGRDEQYRTWFAPFSAFERSQLLGATPMRGTTVSTTTRDPIRAMLLSDLASWLPDNLLERGDRMSMAASLELRPPLLDHKLVELAFRLPSSVKVRAGQSKWILKQVARRYVPKEIVNRKKVGFRVPLDAWFRSSLRDSVFDRLTCPNSFVNQVFDRVAVRRLLERHDTGGFNEDIRIWTLMSLEVWHQAFFVDRVRPQPSSITAPGAS